MKRITTEQVQELYQFTRRHYVEYYDLQTELVDHLANAIEERWKENPEIDFQTCLNLEFKKFGVFGFMDVLEHRQKAMQKRYFKLLFNEAWDFLRQPKTIFFISVLFVSFIAIFQWNYGFEALAVFLAVEISALFIIEIIRLRKYNKQVRQGTRKKYVLEELILTSGKISILFSCAPSFINLLSDLDLNFTSPVLGFILGFLIIFQLLMAYLSFVVLPSKKDKILKNVYPELQFE